MVFPIFCRIGGYLLKKEEKKKKKKKKETLVPHPTPAPSVTVLCKCHHVSPTKPLGVSRSDSQPSIVPPK